MSALADPTGNMVLASTDTTFAVTRGVYIGAAGALKVDDQNGNAVVIPGLLAGVVYPFRIKKVYASGTTIATPTSNVVLLY